MKVKQVALLGETVKVKAERNDQLDGQFVRMNDDLVISVDKDTAVGRIVGRVCLWVRCNDVYRYRGSISCVNIDEGTALEVNPRMTSDRMTSRANDHIRQQVTGHDGRLTQMSLLIDISKNKPPKKSKSSK